MREDDWREDAEAAEKVYACDPKTVSDKETPSSSIGVGSGIGG